MHFESFFQTTVIGMLLIDDGGRILRANPAISELLGYAASEMQGRNLADFILADDQPRWGMLFRALQGKGATGFSEEIHCLSHGRREICARLSVIADPEAAGKPACLIVTVEDCSARKGLESRVRFLSNFDPLTGLPNRALFRDRLEHALQKVRREQKHLALLLLNINRFKNINESFGLRVGDQLLQKVAARLGECVRVTDTVARLDGDRFAIVLEDLSSSAPISPVLRKIMKALEIPFLVEKQELFPKFGVGIAFFPEDATGGESLFRNAETAMARAREDGRNWYQYYTQEMNAHARERLRLESALHRGLERHEFVLHYQPKFQVASGAVTGFEALLRWNHPECGLLEPARFVPLLEETGLIHAVGQWVLQKACRQIKTWRSLGHQSLQMAVNISARQFMNQGFVKMVERTLKETRLEAEALELELTESILMKDIESSTRILSDIASLGVRISVDDFGTGYSSLEYLKRFPVRALKIDRGFIRGIPENGNDAAITLAILSLAANLGLEMVAEGVENEAQLLCLREWGCTQVQGFLFARPLSAENLRPWTESGLPLHLGNLPMSSN